MKYRPEVDGLRALAVLPVILYHAGVYGLSGGFIGVDVFFVISGYLITTILLGELDEGRYSILKFYERRARRILPALTIVILACLPFAWIWMFPSDLKDFGQSVVATSLFSSNIFFWKEANYFSEWNELKPLIHTWSLAVEEQYYILFPPLLALVWKLGRRAVLATIVILFCASLAVAQYTSSNAPEAGFYLLPSRTWELMAGGLCAFALTWRTPKPNEALAFCGLALLAGSYLLFDKETPHPSIWTLIPVFGTALIIVYAQGATRVARLLSQRPVVFIGLISYSAYLWHQPLFAFARLRWIGHPPLSLMLALAGLTLVLAFLSWKFVEGPFRTGRDRPKPILPSRNRLLTASAITLMAVFGIGASLHMLNGAHWRIPERVSALLAAADDFSPDHRYACLLETYSDRTGYKFPPDPRCISSVNENGPRAVILGDSHAAAFSQPLRQALENSGWHVTQLTVSACQPILGLSLDQKDCGAVFEKNLKFIRENKPELTIVASRWSLYFSRVRFNNLEGGIEHSQYEPTQSFDVSKLSQPLQSDVHTAAALESFEQLSAANEHLVIIHPIPEAGWDVPRRAAKLAFYEGQDRPNISTSRAVFEERTQKAETLLSSVNGPNISHVRPADVLCDEVRCWNATEGEILYFDDDHLSLTGARKLVKEIMLSVSAPRGSAESQAGVLN